MADESIRRALKIISDRRQAAVIEAKERYDRVLSEIPRVREIYAKLAETGLRISQIAFTNAEGSADAADKIAHIRAENMELQRELHITLQENGYPSDYLEPHYTCDACEDTGFVESKRCTCLSQLATKLRVEAFSDTINLTPYSFDKFLLKYYPDEPDGRGSSPAKKMADVLSFCKQYAERFSLNAPSVLMVGDTGLGKTHLSLSIANVVIQRGFNVVYVSALEVFRKLQGEYYGRGDGEQSALQTIIDADMLIIDDLGAEFENNFNPSSLYNIVNSRLNAERPTIINTNLSAAELEKRYGQRVASRLMTLYKCLKFAGRDVRQIKLRSNEL